MKLFTHQWYEQPHPAAELRMDLSDKDLPFLLIKYIWLFIYFGLLMEVVLPQYADIGTDWQKAVSFNCITGSCPKGAFTKGKMLKISFTNKGAITYRINGYL